ncbi:MAG: hypothetical protein KDN22_11695 [Verrucomicrobiae bacterium]|nr:hypothetical protein [Verrucomicrobiae bacterium]
MRKGKRAGKMRITISNASACIVWGLVTALVAGVGWQLGKEMKLRHAQGDKSVNVLGNPQPREKAIAVTEGLPKFPEILETIPVDYFPALLEAIESLPEDNGYLLARLVWKTWGRRDPQSAMGEQNAGASWDVLDGWAERDFDAAWKAAGERSNGDYWKRKTIEALAESDPARCGVLIERYLSELAVKLSAYRWLRKPLTAIARTNPDEAFRLARSCDNRAGRGGEGLELQMRIELKMLTQEKIVEIVHEAPNVVGYAFSSLRDAGKYNIAMSAAKQLLEEFEGQEDLLRYVKLLNRELERIQSTAEHAECIEAAMRDPESALADENRSDRRAIAVRWLNDDFAAASAVLFDRTVAGDNFADLVFENGKAFTDTELWTIAQAHPSEAESYLDHDRMLQLTRSIPEAGEHLPFLEAVARRWSSDDRSGALQWIESQPQEFRDPLWFEFLRENDPVGTAMTTFLDEHPASEYQARALRPTDDDPFAVRYPDDSQAQQVIANARVWLTNLPPEEQQSWLRSQVEQGSDLKQLATAFPEELLLSLDTADGSDRFDEIISVWSEADPAAAAAYLANSPPPLSVGVLPATMSAFLGDELRVDEALSFTAKYPTEDRFTLIQAWVDNANITTASDPFAEDPRVLANYLSGLTQLIDDSGFDSRQRGDLLQALDRKLLSK